MNYTSKLYLFLCCLYCATCRSVEHKPQSCEVHGVPLELRKGFVRDPQEYFVIPDAVYYDALMLFPHLDAGATQGRQPHHSAVFCSPRSDQVCPICDALHKKLRQKSL
jgi:hypothetical protein